MVKDKVRDSLLGLRVKLDTKTIVEIARKSLRVSSNDITFKQQFNGEVCETVLELILIDLIEKGKHRDWFYIKGLILPDPDGSSKFLTEIDFVLFTPQCVYCIECKSYAGKKRVVDAGTIITSNGSSRDVYEQNFMHLRILDRMISSFSVYPRYQMLLFNFSFGEIRDERTREQKMEFPVVDEETIYKFIAKSGRKVWDMASLKIAKKKLERFSDNNRERHLAYVKSLKH